MLKTVHGIEYETPMVTLLQDTGIGVAEFAARTCYDSFEASENQNIRELDYQLSSGMGQDHYDESYKDDLNSVEESKLLYDLSHTYFHHSILEHANLSFLIKGTSRGVLQELARHRIASYSVRSTRYTMTPIINAFMASLVRGNITGTSIEDFIDMVLPLEMFVTTDKEYNIMQIADIFNKLVYQYNKMGKNEFIKTALSKENVEYYIHTDKDDSCRTIFTSLMAGKNKRNVGDFVKHITNDNWKVDLVCTFNVRSLKNFYSLRDSGAAYFQIRWLAQEMKKATPIKYLKLIDKDYK